MYKLILIVIISSILSSCLTLRIGGRTSNFENLTTTEKSKIIFNENNECSEIKQDKQKVILLNSKQLLDCMHSNDKSLVVSWVPHCNANERISFDTLFQQLKAKNIQLYIIAWELDMKNIEPQLNKDFQIYGINFRDYNTNNRQEYAKKFFTNLWKKEKLSTEEFTSNYLLFHNSELIKYAKNFEDLNL